MHFCKFCMQNRPGWRSGYLAWLITMRSRVRVPLPAITEGDSLSIANTIRERRHKDAKHYADEVAAAALKKKPVIKIGWTADGEHVVLVPEELNGLFDIAFVGRTELAE